MSLRDIRKVLEKRRGLKPGHVRAQRRDGHLRRLLLVDMIIEKERIVSGIERETGLAKVEAVQGAGSTRGQAERADVRQIVGL
jgi:hypothetical protein